MNLRALFIYILLLVTINSCTYWNDLVREQDKTKNLSPAQIYNEGKAF